MMMSTRLHDAVVRRLHPSGNAAPDGSVRRLTVDVEVGGRVETVMVSLRDGALQCISTDARTDGPHVIAALRFIAGMEQREDSLAPGPPVASSGRPAEPSPPNELAKALEDLLTAVLRVGIEKAPQAPSVEDALERIISVAPQPTPAGLGRFIGRLQQEIETGEARRLARILEGSAQLAEALRAELPTSEVEERLRAWLGAHVGSALKIDPLYDRTMIEVGREWISATERASIERRYLVDIQSGGVYREDRPRSATASLGPCPREIRVGLAEVETGPAPLRIRVLQYEVQPDVPSSSWKRLEQVASRSFAQVTEAYRRAIRAHPSLAEPFALVAPYRIERHGAFKAYDPEGYPLLLDRSQRRGAVLAFYDLVAQGVEPSWLAGRLADTGTTLCLIPFGIGTRDGAYIRL